MPVGGPEAAKRIKNCTKIVLKFDADFGMHFGSENIGKWVPTGSKIDEKACQK